MRATPRTSAVVSAKGHGCPLENRQATGSENAAANWPDFHGSRNAVEHTQGTDRAVPVSDVAPDRPVRPGPTRRPEQPFAAARQSLATSSSRVAGVSGASVHPWPVPNDPASGSVGADDMVWLLLAWHIPAARLQAEVCHSASLVKVALCQSCSAGSAACCSTSSLPCPSRMRCSQ